MDSPPTELERLADAVVARLTSRAQPGFVPEHRSARDMALDRLAYEVACRLAECLRPLAAPEAGVPAAEASAPASHAQDEDEAELADLAARLLGELEDIPKSPLPIEPIQI